MLELLSIFSNWSFGIVILTSAYILVKTWQIRGKACVAPHGIPVYGKRFSGLRFLRHGVEMILENYSHGMTYCVPTLDNYLVLASSEEHINEMVTAPESHLSRRIIVQKQLRPQYTMGGWNVHLNMENNARLQQRVLRTILTSHIPDLEKPLYDQLRRSLDQVLAEGSSNDGWTTVSLLELASRLIVENGCVLFWGDSMAQEQELVSALRVGPERMFLAAALLGYVPTVLAPTLASLITKKHQDLRTVERYAIPLIEQSLRERGTEDVSDGKQAGNSKNTIVQWIIDSSPKKEAWTAKQVFNLAFAYWLAIVYPFRITFFHALCELCEHPADLKELRAEIQGLAIGEGTIKQLDDLPILDSFLKEAGRLNQSDSVVNKREVTALFTFSSGVQVPKGNWLAVPLRAILRDPVLYPDPSHFNMHRFVSKDNTSSENGADSGQSRYTDGSPKYPFWGLGKRMCPGRFYASSTIKMMLADIILRYDVELVDANVPRQRFVKTTPILNGKVQVRFRSR